LQFADVSIDFTRYEATRAGQRVELTRKEFGLLRLLAAKEGLVVTRDELLEKVWGYDATPTTRTVDNHLAALRAKLEQDAAQPKHLRTVHGVGYKLVIS
jgi:DNA-binding response OmpR family regulator